MPPFNSFTVVLFGAMAITATTLTPDVAAAGKQTAHWSYSGDTGPEHWGGISQQFALCSSGRRQSPIDIHDQKPADLYPLRFDYQPIKLEVLNNGHTLQANYGSTMREQVKIGATTHAVSGQTVYTSRMMLGDVTYQLLQLHVHAPSEHTINGERYPMEVHLVHQNAEGNLAVIGVLLKEGGENATLQNLLDNAPAKAGEVKAVKSVLLNAAALLPKKHRYSHYTGSLTTPPCSENVNWLVMSDPMEVSSAQVNRFVNIIGNNARPVQAMHWRSVFVSNK